MEDLDGVWVVDRGGCAALVLEARAEDGVERRVRCDQLESDRPVEREVGRAEHDTHAAAPGQRLDAMPRERVTDFQLLRHSSPLSRLRAQVWSTLDARGSGQALRRREPAPVADGQRARRDLPLHDGRHLEDAAGRRRDREHLRLSGRGLRRRVEADARVGDPSRGPRAGGPGDQGRDRRRQAVRARVPRRARGRRGPLGARARRADDRSRRQRVARRDHLRHHRAPASEQLRLERETEAARIEELEASRAPSSRRPTRRAGGSSATFTTAPSSAWWSPRCTSARRSSTARSNGDTAALLEAARSRARRRARGAARARARDPPDATDDARADPGRAGAGGPLRGPGRARREARRATRAGRARLRSTTPSRKRSRTSTATRAPRGRRFESGAIPMPSSSRCTTTAAAARTARAAPACVAWKTGWERSAASSSSRARRVAARGCAHACRWLGPHSPRARHKGTYGRLTVQRLGEPDEPARPPGPQLADSGVNAFVDRFANPDDAWSVRLREGRTYRINFVTSGGGCAQLSLFLRGIGRLLRGARPHDALRRAHRLHAIRVRTLPAACTRAAGLAGTARLPAASRQRACRRHGARADARQRRSHARLAPGIRARRSRPLPVHARPSQPAAGPARRAALDALLHVTRVQLDAG